MPNRVRLRTQGFRWAVAAVLGTTLLACESTDRVATGLSDATAADVSTDGNATADGDAFLDAANGALDSARDDGNADATAQGDSPFHAHADADSEAHADADADGDAGSCACLLSPDTHSGTLALPCFCALAGAYGTCPTFANAAMSCTSGPTSSLTMETYGACHLIVFVRHFGLDVDTWTYDATTHAIVGAFHSTDYSGLPCGATQVNALGAGAFESDAGLHAAGCGIPQSVLICDGEAGSDATARDAPDEGMDAPDAGASDATRDAFFVE